MRQKIQRLLFFSVGMSSLVLVSEPMIPSIQPALAAAGQDTVTVRQNNSHEKSQNPSQIDGKVIAQKNELTRATAPSHRLIVRTTSPQTSVEMSNDVSLQPSSSSSPVAPSGSDDSRSRGMSSQFSGPTMAIPSAQLGSTMRPGFSATPVAKEASSLLGSTAPTSKAVAAPQASPMQTQPATAPMRRLMSEMPELKQLAAPSFPISSLKPAIGVSSPSLSFSAQQGDDSPTTQTLTVTNRGGGTLNWNAASTAAWLSLSPASGKDTGTIALTVIAGSLAIGTYNAIITLNAAGAIPVIVPVNLTISVPVSSGPPVIRTSPASLSFTAELGSSNSSSQTVSISNTGGGLLTWSASENVSWLSISPTSGTGNGVLTVTATTGALTAGTYNAQVTVSAPNATPVSVPVLFTVTAPSPTLTVSPTAVTFSGVQGGTNPASQSVTVSSNSNWTASSNTPWLTLSPSSGNGNGSLAANVTLASAAVGTNQATITVTSGGVTRTAAVTLTVSAASLTASPNSLTYTATQGAPNPVAQTVTISSNGTWTVSDNAAWLSLSPTASSNNGTITASVNTATATLGSNSATITVMGGGITRTVNVALTLNPQASSSVTLTWNANTESDLAGYKVYRATSSGAYGAPIAAILGNTTSYTATGLQFNATYFFVVTAYDIAGNESAYSNEVSKSVY